MSQSIQSLIAASVNGVLRRLYPEQYCSLCHAHAIVGANLISIVLGKVYRPVAGLALIDCGSDYIRLLDNDAFANPAGGAFHCWIESADASFVEPEVVDLTFRHNHEYAARNGMQWTRARPPDYLWGAYSEVVVQAELDALPDGFDDGQVWLRETNEGWDWITCHMAENMQAYVRLTAEALQELERRLPAASTLLPAARQERAPVQQACATLSCC